MSPLPVFADFFKALWEDKEPFPWQVMLAERVTKQGWPDAIDLPTASGKTACVDIAIYSLAAQFERPLGERAAARRIWFVVDRRIVVDEAYERAGRIAKKLADKSAPPAIRAVAERLLGIRGLSSQERPLAVGRLRGGVLRDDGWARIPSQPAIITSTVDQLGSRLLFRSYGNSPLTAPVYAGLASNDSLILLDEAHCAVPFLQTLRSIQKYRSPKWSVVPNKTPFHVTVLSATPPSEESGSDLEVFPAEPQRERALANETLQLRLRASKKAVLKKVRDEKRMGEELASTAAEFASNGKQRIGIIVNRVGRAKEIAAILREKLKEANSPDGQPPFDVQVLTGRIRPVERDILVDGRLNLVLHSSVTQSLPRPLILIATQCLEVGADFSFDALATECASLDALRQRFGRLDRLGTFPNSPAAIFTAESLLEEPDPIYGEALRNTWEFLQENAATENTKEERRIVDFGVTALGPLLPEGEGLRKLLAPAPNAPVLLPAHLDLLCQTAPQPHPDPDLAPFLHGKGRGVAEVRVVWRCDFAGIPPTQWPEVVSLCRPVAGEMFSVPLYRFLQWLGGRRSADETGDVEGATVERNGEQAASFATPHFLIWRGREGAKVLNDPDKILPGSVVVLPIPETTAEAESLSQTLGEGLGSHRLDLWERAWQGSGRPPALRLNRDCLAPWLDVCQPLRDLLELVQPCDSDESPEWEVEELRDALGAIRDWNSDDETSPQLPGWLRALLKLIGSFRDRRDTAEHPAGGLIVRARPKPAIIEEPDFFADDDDEMSEAPEEVKLSAHTADVARRAGWLAHTCLGEDVMAVVKHAAQWHDAGKLDERFQIILRGGQTSSNGEPLAKSPDKPRSREQAKALSDAANLPDGFRHEMLSLQLAEPFGSSGLAPEDRELFLHLIAAHHGHARPFAPVCEDREPPPISGQLNGTEISVTAVVRKSFTVPHLLNSGVSDRFWKLNRRYGWWGLAYREAIVRLADWYASAHPESGSRVAEKES